MAGGGGGWTEDILILTLFEGGTAWGERGGRGGRGGGKCPRPITLKLLIINEMKFGGVVKDH